MYAAIPQLPDRGARVGQVTDQRVALAAQARWLAPDPQVGFARHRPRRRGSQDFTREGLITGRYSEVTS
jgi:hypothetical protein